MVAEATTATARDSDARRAAEQPWNANETLGNPYPRSL